MSRQPVAELMVQRQTALVTRTATTGPHPQARGGDLQLWVDQAPVSAKTLVVTGLALAGGGLLAATLLPTFGALGLAAMSTAITLGGGLTFMGIRKKKGEFEAAQPAPPMTPQTDPTVLAERARRVRHVLDVGEATFEALLAQLRWTESALVETLLAMKDSGSLEEDLNLDTGEWVYRVQMGNATGMASSMTLEDRRAQPGAE